MRRPSAASGIWCATGLLLVGLSGCTPPSDAAAPVESGTFSVTFPADAQWQTLLQGGTVMGDVASDGQNK